MTERPARPTSTNVSSAGRRTARAARAGASASARRRAPRPARPATRDRELDERLEEVDGRARAPRRCPLLRPSSSASPLVWFWENSGSPVTTQVGRHPDQRRRADEQRPADALAPARTGEQPQPVEAAQQPGLGRSSPAATAAGPGPACRAAGARPRARRPRRRAPGTGCRGSRAPPGTGSRSACRGSPPRRARRATVNDVRARR